MPNCMPNSVHAKLRLRTGLGFRVVPASICTPTPNWVLIFGSSELVWGVGLFPPPPCTPTPNWVLILGALNWFLIFETGLWFLIRLRTGFLSWRGRFLQSIKSMEECHQCGALKRVRCMKTAGQAEEDRKRKEDIKALIEKYDADKAKKYDAWCRREQLKEERSKKIAKKPRK
jgi:hypothetical protein